MSADDLAAWLLLLTFDRVRFVEGKGWQMRPRVADDATPWRSLAAHPDLWLRRVATAALGRDPAAGDVGRALRDDALLHEAMALLARDSHVFVPAPAESARPLGVLVDLDAARRRRMARAS